MNRIRKVVKRLSVSRHLTSTALIIVALLYFVGVVSALQIDVLLTELSESLQKICFSLAVFMGFLGLVLYGAGKVSPDSERRARFASWASDLGIGAVFVAIFAAAIPTIVRWFWRIGESL